MSLGIDAFTMGVEEEYQIVDATTRELAARQARLLPVAEKTLSDAVQPELQLSMIEIATPVCGTLADVRRELERARHDVIEAARTNGSRIAAAGTHPFSAWSEQPITPKERYRKIASDFGQVARETVIFGCHVHVGLENRDVALDVMNRVRSQLSPLLALSANSPYWLGADSSYASFRTEVWSRWPMSGPPLAFASKDEYDELIATLIAAGVIEDETKIYWDVRPSGRFPTLEVRVSDVCMTVDEAVMLAGLTRALVRRAYLAGQRNEEAIAVRHELVRAAHWRAARYGLDGELIDARTGGTARADESIEAMLRESRDALDEAGDYDEIAALVRATLRRGNGAARQRAVFARTGRLEDVVDYIVQQTAS
ncbi:MAG: glutamate--cysteine ligase [Vulcanimicrobiaceae bacterium]